MPVYFYTVAKNNMIKKDYASHFKIFIVINF